MFSGYCSITLILYLIYLLDFYNFFFSQGLSKEKFMKVNGPLLDWHIAIFSTKFYPIRERLWPMNGKHWYSLKLLTFSFWTWVLKINWWHLRNCDLSPLLLEPLFPYITWPEGDLLVALVGLATWVQEVPRWSQKACFVLYKCRNLCSANCPLACTLMLTFLGTDPASSRYWGRKRGN